MLQYNDQSRAGAETRGTPRATVRRRHQGCQGGQQKRWTGRNRAAASVLLNFFFSSNEHGKATKPPQKHICTCCSHLNSQDKLTSARSPKLQQPEGPPEKRSGIRNAPLTQPPSAFPEAPGAPPRLCQWLDTSTMQPSRTVGPSALAGAVCNHSVL